MGRHALNRAVPALRKATRRILPTFRRNRRSRHGSRNLPALALQLIPRKPHENKRRSCGSQRFRDLHSCYDLARDRATRGMLATAHCRHYAYRDRASYMHSIMNPEGIPAASRWCLCGILAVFVWNPCWHRRIGLTYIWVF